MSTDHPAPPQDDPQASKGPLAGLRVLELANVIAGPTAGQILGDFGAEIIKIEHPDGGDGARNQGRNKNGIPLWWKMIGRNKHSVGMYLGDPEVAEIFCKMVATADVVVEGFRPGTLEKWGLGYDRLAAINPRIILARLTGFGQTGPYAARPAFGSNVESMSGMAHLTGQPDGPPTMPVFALGDFIAGTCCMSAILMAVLERERSGRGQVIDASLFLPLITTMTRPILYYDQLGIRETRIGNRATTGAPRNIYRTSDGKWVGVSGATNELARRIMKLVERPEIAKEPWFNSSAGRYEHVELIDAAVADWMKVRTRDEVVAAAEAAQVTFAPLYEIDEVVADRHVRATDMITAVEDPDLGTMRMPNVMFNFSRTPGSIRWTGQSLGASTDKVLTEEFGVPAEAVARMRERGVVL
jgi:crotonobetainyl-CoA:carnitine CoA-transferase CaiB-like acyl-CoA transferase